MWGSRPHPSGGEYSVAGYQANIVTPDAHERFGFLYDENARGALANLGEQVEITRSSGNEVERKIISALESPADLSKVVRPYPEWNDHVKTPSFMLLADPSQRQLAESMTSTTSTSQVPRYSPQLEPLIQLCHCFVGGKIGQSCEEESWS